MSPIPALLATTAALLARLDSIAETACAVRTALQSNPTHTLAERLTTGIEAAIKLELELLSIRADASALEGQVIAAAAVADMDRTIERFPSALPLAPATEERFAALERELNSTTEPEPSGG